MGSECLCGLHADLPCSLIPGLRVNTQRSMRRMLKPHTTPMGSLRGKKLNALPLLGDGGILLVALLCLLLVSDMLL